MSRVKSRDLKSQIINITTISANNHNSKSERTMQKREQNKSGGPSGGASAPPAKRGRPIGSTSSSSAAAASASAAADAAAPSALLGPSFHVHNSFAGKRFQNPSTLFFFILNLDGSSVTCNHIASYWSERKECNLRKGHDLCLFYCLNVTG